MHAALYQIDIRDRAGEQEAWVQGSPEASCAHNCPGGGGILQLHLRGCH